MPIITKKNFIPIVCWVYTVITLGKLIVEAVMKKSDPYYFENFITIFLISIVATAVLSLHYYFVDYPLTLVIIGQYLGLLGLIFLGIWIEGHFTKLSESAYMDMFWSFSIPYIILAGFYYYNYFVEVKRANDILKDIKENNKNN